MVSNWRGIIGPKAMTEAQVAYWDRALRRLIDSAEWKKELDMNFWTSEYLKSAQTRKHMEQDSVQARAFLVDLGLAK